MNNPLTSASDIIAKSREISQSGVMKIGVAAAQDRDVLAAVVEAKSENIAEPILVGDKTKITALAQELNLDISNLELIDVPGEAPAAAKTAELARDGVIQAVMKGFLPTSTLLKTILKPEYNLKIRDTLSHSALLTIPGYHKMINITDGGMIMEPTLEQKIEIVRNAALVLNAIGVEKPKVAFHSANNHIRLDVKSSLECAILAKMAQNGQLGNIIGDGPITLDCAMNSAAAKLAGIDSPVAGDADILIVSTFDEGNVAAKALINFVDAVFSGVVIGSKVPVSLVSRTDSAMNKKSSIALAIVIADYINKHFD